MIVEFATKIPAGELLVRQEPEHISVSCDENGRVIALSWLYQTSDAGLYKMVKRRQGVWNSAAGGWTFADPTIAESLFNTIVKKHPEWPIIGHPSKSLLLAQVRFSRIHLDDGLEACLLPLPLPYYTRIEVIRGMQHIFEVKAAGSRGQKVGLLVGSAAEINAFAESMVSQGATCNNTLAKQWSLSTSARKVQVSVTGWAVQIACDLSNPLHYRVAPEQKYRWQGVYPNGIKVLLPWDGMIHTTRKLWPGLKARLQTAELEWEGDNPEAEPIIPIEFDTSRVAGWDTSAPNGSLMHAYQKDGARFCASRGMRALIGDEMGVGKTVQAIAAAEAIDAPRILIICPANARYVWDREIQGWGGRGNIQHITNQLDKLDLSARWHIITYDLIAARAETWRLRDEQEERVFRQAFPDLATKIEKKRGGGYPRTIGLEKPLVAVPAYADQKRIAAWQKMMQRLRGELLEQILSVDQLLTVLDEAHRAKNKTSKRTKAIQRIAAAVGEKQMLMLTGTPLRNNEHEAAVLLGLLDAEASTALSKEKGYTIQDVKDYLNYFMIRRTKAEVLPELPPKTRQRIDIGDLDSEQMNAYQSALNMARESYYHAVKSGASEAGARQHMQGGIEQARTALGIAKVRGGEVIDLVLDVVENKGCCVVFCAHHLVSDSLKVQLEKEKLRVAIVDGRTSQKDRAVVVDDFQDGRLDVFIGSINAAGEAITLTRADTIIFVELDWVPAALLQAEDRIHRVGQRSNCHIIQLVARIQEGDNLDEMMVDLIGSKMAKIGAVLDEDTANIIPGGIQAQLHERLLVGVGTEKEVLASAPEDRSPYPDSASSAPDPDEAAEEMLILTSAAPNVEKSKRGRPKVYTEKAPPTATERSKQSIQALANAGGKRIMLRLNPEAHEALKVIMAITGNAQETAAINQALVARKNELLR